MKRLACERDDAKEETKEEAGAPTKRVNMPKKNKHRMHAHINPFGQLQMAYPRNADFVDWSIHYPSHFEIPNNNGNKIYVNTKQYPCTYDEEVDISKRNKVPTILDIGCGYGGLLFELKKGFPDQLILGLEIRDKVANFVGEKINTLRINSGLKDCTNLGVIRTNAMKTMHNYFAKESVSKLCPSSQLTSFRLTRCSSALRTLTLRNQTIEEGLSTLLS